MKVLDEIAMDQLYVQMRLCERLMRPRRLKAVKYYDQDLGCQRVGMVYCQREIFSITADNMLIINTSAVDDRRYEIERYLKVIGHAPDDVSQGRDNVVIAIDTQYRKINDMTQTTMRVLNALFRAFNIPLSLLTDTKTHWCLDRWTDNRWDKYDDITPDNQIKVIDLASL